MIAFKVVADLPKSENVDIDLGNGIVIELDRHEDGTWRFWSVALDNGERFGRKETLTPKASQWMEAHR